MYTLIDFPKIVHWRKKMALNEKGYRSKWKYWLKTECDGCYYDVESCYCVNYRCDTNGVKLPQCTVERPVKGEKPDA